MTWIVGGAGLVVLVFLHELGHFTVARAVGMRPRSFYVFFPPALVKVRRNGIEYGIGMIPLGGLVRIPGMHRPAARDLRAAAEPAVREQPSLAPSVGLVRRALDAEDYEAARHAYPELERELSAAALSPGARRSAERGLRDVEEGTAPEAYWRAPTWKRVAVIAAGPLANVVIAFVILFYVFAVSGGPSQRPSATVAQVEAGTPAAAAGLQVGDRIVAVDGRAIHTFADASHLIRGSHGRRVTLTVVRNGRQVTVGPRRTIERQGSWIFGFVPAAHLVRYPVGQAAQKAGSNLWGVVSATGTGLRGLLSSHGRSQLSGPGGIVRTEHQALQVGVPYYLEILAFVSMSLALLNLLPLLPLDGGHILFSLIEAVRRRALAREVYERVSVIGFAFILLLLVIASSNDFPGIAR
ncbi:MAG TPA: M50 family metallopeptidase [Gaiellaceae bacterium]|jgi:regulator of sigma E protease|nr:M50 family metallopeptidase [Gaiellaceae bacterium]